MRPSDAAEQAAAVALDALEAASGERDLVALVRALVDDPKAAPDEVVAELIAMLFKARPRASGLVRRISVEVSGFDVEPRAQLTEIFWGQRARVAKAAPAAPWMVREHSRIVSWHDTEAEALEALEALAPCSAAIVRDDDP